MTRARSDPARLALLVAIVLALQPTRPSPESLLAMGGLATALAISVRGLPGRAAVVVLLVAALLLRVGARDLIGSDVLNVTEVAIRRALEGLNPYGVSYEASTPPGAPFPYGPLALLWYLPSREEPRLLELLASTIVLAVLALQGRLLGLAIYGCLAPLVLTSIDGSNDTTLGLLLLGAFLVADRSKVLAGAILAGAVAFKVSALAWVPAFALWAGVVPTAAFAAASAVLWAPIVFVWGLGSFAWSLGRASDLHGDIVWSLGQLLRPVFGSAVRILDGLRYVFGGLVAIVTLQAAARSRDGVILAGIGVYLVTMFGGTWGSYAYLAAIAPLACWRIDDWLRLETFPLADGPAPSPPVSSTR